MSSSLIDPSLLEGLTEEQKQEALAAAAAAKRAEERAEQRALERAMRERQAQRRNGESSSHLSSSNGSTTKQPQRQVLFVSKKQRAKKGEQRNEKDTAKMKPSTASLSTNGTATTKPPRPAAASSSSTWNDSQLLEARKTYLGKSVEQEAPPPRKQRRSKKKMFKFQWDDTDDTSHLDQDDPLYAGSFSFQKKKKKQRLDQLGKSTTPTIESARSKPIDQMTARDWRIFREEYDIHIKGGRAPPPMRQFDEPPSSELPLLNKAILDAIFHTLKYKEPSPIQRQAIPIGLQRRDLIGIAETGSGKTAAFGVPLCHYLLSLPTSIVENVADEGPLALVMAPTRELALQIDAEFQKILSRQSLCKSTAIVGGQAIQQQAQKLRDGVHVVVGTPGRMNDCLEMAYLVLNQCCYVVLDEADRMIDMGFAPQIQSILDAMGGALKSEDEAEAYAQEVQDLQSPGLPKYRLTAMFTATMPPEVERMAKEYLRHPAVISIGDQDSVKNARITQRIVFLSSPSQKEKALVDLLQRSRSPSDKIIVFVNEKKHADGVGRMVERAGKRCVVMHGGKTQEQREEYLDTFRRGGGVIMVATDVAGRGLDIPNVSHVINYDLPTRSIDNYSHRIGRTGRAGKEGLATSFITDEDEAIMPALKSYLEATGNSVPDRLARHPAANVGSTGANIT